jgi:cell division protein ZapA
LAKADISFRGRNFSIACAPGQEKRIQRLGDQLHDRASQISAAVGDIGEDRLLLITALALLDELDGARRQASGPSEAELRAAEQLAGLAAKVEALAARLENDT